MSFPVGILLRREDGSRTPFDPAEVYHLEPPVNRVLPVSEARAGDLWQAFGER